MLKVTLGEVRAESREVASSQDSGKQGSKTIFSAAEFQSSKESLKKFLCSYFTNGNCTEAQGNSIRCIGATHGGGKILKVRWAVPGCGKSGGLRLSVVVYCEKRRVVIAEAFIRKDDPADREFMDSVAGLE
jgi:hypothetical protein